MKRVETSKPRLALAIGGALPLAPMSQGIRQALFRVPAA